MILKISQSLTAEDTPNHQEKFYIIRLRNSVAVLDIDHFHDFSYHPLANFAIMNATNVIEV
jgi:hypothetical protein